MAFVAARSGEVTSRWIFGSPTDSDRVITDVQTAFLFPALVIA
jgi:hypothetical protein